MQSLTIRKATLDDWPQIWPIVKEVIREGYTYPYSPDTTEEEALTLWMHLPLSTYVAIDGNTVVGTYYIKPNQPGLGSHICNAGYMVSSQTRARGIGKSMCLHSLTEAAQLGFRAMQFNLVVSTNIPAVKLWKEMGFSIIGILPKGFNHQDKGFVDAYIMYRSLVKQA